MINIGDTVEVTESGYADSIGKIGIVVANERGIAGYVVDLDDGRTIFADKVALLTKPLTPKPAPITHAEMVTRLVKSGEEILASLTPAKCNLLHAVLGIAGECGELVDIVKKHCIYNQPLDEGKLEHLKEESGDMEFYLEQLRQEIKLTREAILEGNMAKLAKRYEGFKYSDAAAKERADKK